MTKGGEESTLSLTKQLCRSEDLIMKDMEQETWITRDLLCIVHTHVFVGFVRGIIIPIIIPMVWNHYAHV